MIDDAAPVATDQREPVDEIGTVKIPLRGLMLEERRIETRFPIINKAGEHCGLLDIELVMTETL